MLAHVHFSTITFHRFLAFQLDYPRGSLNRLELPLYTSRACANGVTPFQSRLVLYARFCSPVIIIMIIKIIMIMIYIDYLKNGALHSFSPYFFHCAFPFVGPQVIASPLPRSNERRTLHVSVRGRFSIPPKLKT